MRFLCLGLAILCSYQRRLARRQFGPPSQWRLREVVSGEAFNGRCRRFDNILSSLVRVALLFKPTTNNH